MNKNIKAINYSWPDQIESISKIIKSQKSVFKIIIKIKNETDILEDWLEHHLKIVGDFNIIILDNGSTNEKTLNIYKKYQDRINLFGFYENHNLIHDTKYFLKFYEILQDSTKFYSFIDVDEFLYFTEGNSCISNEEFMNILQKSSDESIFFGLWALNVPGNSDLFYISDNPKRYPNSLIWGKPIISSKYKLSGFINHNIQLFKNNPSLKPTGGVLVCHLTMVDRNRRIMINREKILAHKFLKNNNEIDEIILNGNVSKLSGPLLVYINEIIKCKNENWVPANYPEVGIFKINKDLSIDFGDETARKKLFEFNINCAEHWSKLLLGILV